MIIERDELVELYCGLDNTPGQWRTVDEVAEHMGTTPDEIRSLLAFYKVPERGPEAEVYRLIWEILVNEWFMEPEKDFVFRGLLVYLPVDFYIEADGIGFNIDSLVHEKTIAMLHIHGVNLFKLNPNLGLDLLGEQVRKTLKDSRVRKRSRLNAKPKNQTGW